MRRSKPVLLLVGHGAIPTGFARVLHHLTAELLPNFDLHHYAINLPAGTSSPPSPCAVHGNPFPGDLHDPQPLVSLLDTLAPDLVLVLDEPWACARLMPAFTARPQIRVALYLAIHGSDSLTPSIVQALSAADALVAFTPNAARLLRESLPTTSPRLAVIPHGVDTSVFHPLAFNADNAPAPQRRALARKALFPDAPDLQDAFLILNANRNQPLKGIDRCLEGFAHFVRDKPPAVKLYLHMGSRPTRPDEVSLVDRLGLRDRILPLHSTPHHPHASDAWLNLLYNACDIGINTSQREGWGLIAFEHAATGAAQIVPNHTSGAELWPNAALLLETDTTAVHPLTAGSVRVESVARSLETLYTDATARDALATKAFVLATSPAYQWPTLGRVWTKLLKSLLPHPLSQT